MLLEEKPVLVQVASVAVPDSLAISDGAVESRVHGVAHMKLAGLPSRVLKLAPVVFRVSEPEGRVCPLGTYPKLSLPQPPESVQY
jgi:hypothetical protein